jgi:hypothetical protein
MEGTHRLFTLKGIGFQIPRKRRPLDLTRESPWSETAIQKPQYSTTEGPYTKRKEFPEFSYGIKGPSY